MRVVYQIVFVLLVLAVNGCVSYEGMLNYNESPGIPTTPQNITNYKPLTIQPNDLLQIQISITDPVAAAPFRMSGAGGESEGGASDRYLVNSEGYIDYPTLGKIQLKDLSILEGKNKISALLEPYFQQAPILQVRLTNFRVTVNGEVGSPGSFTVNNDRMTVLEALTMAGDFTSYSRRDSILIIRERGEVRNFGYVDFNSSEVFNSPYYYLQQNDIIYVRPKKAIISSVRDPATRFLPWVSAFVSLTALIITISRTR